MSIYDLYPYRSLIKYIQNSGFDVYLIDWGKLNYRNQNLNFLSFIDDAIPHCLEQIKEHGNVDHISLHGWSMGGIFATLYTALHQPAMVKNLMVMGSPMDSYASGRIGLFFQKLAQLLAKKPELEQKILNGHIPKKFLHTPGLINALGFKIIDPIGWLKSQKQLLSNLNSQQVLQEHATLGHFLNHMIDYPGGINQDMVFNIWLQNPLKNGQIQLHGKNIALKNIECSLMVGAALNDQIVSKEAAQPLCTLTSSQDVTFSLIPGGHLGMISSQRSADVFWPTLRHWLEQRSTAI